MKRIRLLFSGLALLLLSIYLGCAFLYGHLGFPLDDAWIYQTYARNLILYGELAYNLGQPSSGFTSPLWTFLISLGYLLRINFKLWAYLLGALFLSLTSLTVYRLGSTLFPQRKEFPLIAGVFCSLEWHLVWAAFSGMETMLFTFLSLLLIEQCLRYEPRFRIGGFLLKGLTGGLLTLTRPEGVILFAITFLLHLAFVNKLRAEKVASAILLCIGFAIPFLPYIALNLTTTGLAFPSSFYAKQKEYRAMAEGLPFASRIFRVIKSTLVGAQALLLPGFFYGMYKKFKRIPLLPLSWFASLTLLYAWRLPVDYQHGRYVMPLIPIFILYGVWGTLSIFQLDSPHFVKRVISRTALLSIIVLLFAFVIIGARAYATDVCIIESEMVTVGRWLRENTPSDTLIATHDIGAIGYHSERTILDMAGLITPDVIPFIRDEEKLLAFIEERGADYLVTFPSWYPRIVEESCIEPIWRTNSQWTRIAGGENMVIYRVRCNQPES